MRRIIPQISPREKRAWNNNSVMLWGHAAERMGKKTRQIWDNDAALKPRLDIDGPETGEVGDAGALLLVVCLVVVYRFLFVVYRFLFVVQLRRLLRSAEPSTSQTVSSSTAVNELLFNNVGSRALRLS